MNGFELGVAVRARWADLSNGDLCRSTEIFSENHFKVACQFREWYQMEKISVSSSSL